MGTHPSKNMAMPRVDLRVPPGPGTSAPVLGQLLGSSEVVLGPLGTRGFAQASPPGLRQDPLEPPP